MAKMKVAIYDSDKRYRERFADYLMNYKSQEMDLSVFSGENYLLDALNVDKYSLIVLGCGYEEVLKGLKSCNVPILVLTEVTGSLVRETSGFAETYTSVPKYQSMEEITRQMYMLAEPQGAKRTGVKATIIGIISPIKDELQLPFSLLMCKNLGEREKVLYLNLMDFSGFYEIFGEKQLDLADAVLTVRATEESQNLSGCIYEKDKISYICPLQNPEDTRDITGEDIIELIRIATETLGFETVVLDLGGMLEDFPRLLQECDVLYCLCKGGGLFAAQQKQFFDYLRRAAGESYSERVKELELPRRVKNLTYGEHLLEQLNWSEFGDYVRTLMRG